MYDSTLASVNGYTERPEWTNRVLFPVRVKENLWRGRAAEVNQRLMVAARAAAVSLGGREIRTEFVWSAGIDLQELRYALRDEAVGLPAFAAARRELLPLSEKAREYASRE
jgi:hypothetical protein